MKNTNIINFPKPQAVRQKIKDQKNVVKNKNVVTKIVFWPWLGLVLVWPILKWIISTYVFFLGIKVFYYWSDPGFIHVLNFLFYFVVFVFLIYLVSAFEIKNNRL